MSEKDEIFVSRDGRDEDYCEQHCHVAYNARNSVPRWAFLSSLSTMIVVALAFGGWHISSLKKLELTLAATIVAHKQQTATRIADGNDKYTQDVERFIRAVGENRVALIGLTNSVGEVKIRLGRAEAKQDLILEKVQLTK